MSDSGRPHRRQSTRLPRPWDSPGKNTGVGCHFLLQCRKVESQSEVVQSCLTLSDPTDCSLPGSSVHGIFQARGLSQLLCAPKASMVIFDLPSINEHTLKSPCSEASHRLFSKMESSLNIVWSQDNNSLRISYNFLFLINFYWSIAALQCCVSFYCKVNQWYIYTCPLSFGFPSHLGHQRALNRVPWAIQ